MQQGRAGMTASGNATRELGRDAQRLLLLASRESWDDQQAALAGRLAAGVGDWDALCDVAIRSLGACLVLHSLSKLPAGVVPPHVLARMRGITRVLAGRSLQLDGALLDIHARLLGPLGVRHAFFKGAALAHRYYAMPAARPCRDIDVLVDAGTALDTVRRACALGFVPVEDVGKGERALAGWVKRATVYPLRSPDGVLLEVHRSLDHGDGLLDVDRMLQNVETLAFRGQSIPVLRTADLFVYVCMHHTRHFWSHLHWYADLDAMTGDPRFDLAEVRNAAAGARLLPTVDACLQLHAMARGRDWPEALSLARGPAEALLARSIECLEGGHDREVALRVVRLSHDRAFAWQSSRRERLALWVRKQRNRFIGGAVRRVRAWWKSGAATNPRPADSAASGDKTR
jgi:hypothetical protein